MKNRSRNHLYSFRLMITTLIFIAQLASPFTTIVQAQSVGRPPRSVPAQNAPTTATTDQTEVTVPEGLTASEWDSIQTQIRQSETDASPLLVNGSLIGPEGEKLTASDAAGGDNFGYSVSVSENTAIIGAFLEDNGGFSSSGAAYIFARNEGGADSWDQVKKLTASDADSADQFGISVSIHGDTAIVGAPRNDDAGVDSGSAYIFARNQGGANNWGEVRKLTASDSASGDTFGYAVDTTNDMAIVGAYGNADAGSSSGSAYIFYINVGGVNNWGEYRKLTASDAAAGDHFGFSVGISNDSAIVGAPKNDDAGLDSGSAYIFARDEGGGENWGEMQKLTGSGAGFLGNFGGSVDISADTAIVGAQNEGAGFEGVAYIFTRNHGGVDNWGEVSKLNASDASSNDSFGESVSISGGTVVVGASNNGNGGVDSGSAYIFTRNEGGGLDNWGEVGKLNASDAANTDKFGIGVGISGNVIVVGAFEDDDAGLGSGSAYTFLLDSTGWREREKQIASDGVTNDQFGYSVQVSGDTLVVGTPGYFFDTGAAYIFARNQGGAEGWGQVKKIIAGDPHGGASFGSSVAIGDDVVVVSAHLDDIVANNAGAVYVFERNEGGADNWGQVVKLTAPDAAANDYFGESVGITNNDTIVVGARYGDEVVADSGSAYIFVRNLGADWGFAQEITANDAVFNSGFGRSVSISDNILVVGSGEAAYVFYRNQGGANLWGQVKKISASDGVSGDQFGSAVDIMGDSIVVGAYGNDDAGNSSGSAYIFERNQGGADNWGEVKKLTADDAAASGFFGISVSIGTDKLVVGASGGRVAIGGTIALNTGAAYVFDRNNGGADNWGQLQKLAASDFMADDSFGFSTDIDGNRVVVGAYTNDDDGNSSGSSYVFEASRDCRVTSDNGATVFYGEGALQTAFTAAPVGSTIKIAGTCHANSGQNVLNLTKDITLVGGFSAQDWTNSDPKNNPTYLDGLNQGTVIYVYPGVHATVENVKIVHGKTNFYGGGINNSGTLHVTNSAILFNYGGGVFNTSGGTLTLSNSTVSGNKASFSPGFLGGGIRNHINGGIVHVINSTLSDNEGGGVVNATGKTMNLTNTIVANSINSTDCNNFGTLNDNGYNLIETGSCLSHPTSISGEDPLLVPLVDNVAGGFTNMLLPDSPAINAGDCSNGTITMGQNGVRRPYLLPAFCDIGAYERVNDGDTTSLPAVQNFRLTELTDWGLYTNIVSRSITILPGIRDNYATYDGGSLFTRYCADFDQLESDLTNLAQDNPNISCIAGASPTNPYDVYNTLQLSSQANWERAYQTEGIDTPAYNAALTESLSTLREQNYIFMTYGNEFYADAVRHSVWFTGTGATIISQEIALFEQAYQQFHLVTLSMSLAGQRQMVAGSFGAHFSEGDLEMFGIASKRQAETILEIARRQRLLGNINTSITLLETEYDRQQSQAAFFYLWAQSQPSPDDVIANNFGPEMAIAIENLARTADDFRSTNNPLGYRDDYVPKNDFDDLMAEIFKTAGPLQKAEAFETQARTATLEYEQNEADMVFALSNLNVELAENLIELCDLDGYDVEAWDDPCEGGAMGKNFQDLLAVARQVDLAKERFDNYAQLIQIEDELADFTINVALESGEILSSRQIQIGLLNADQTVTTNFDTDSYGVKATLTTEVKYSVKTEAKASVNPFKSDASVATSLEASVALAVEGEVATTHGTTVEKTSNPNLAEIAELEAANIWRGALDNATITGAQSAAEIKRLYLAQAEAWIEVEIAQAEFNAVLAEHNLLVTQYQILLDWHDDVLAGGALPQIYYTQPAYRLIHDSTNVAAQQSFTRLVNYAFLAAKALEYKILNPDEGINYNNLYTARSTFEVRTFLEDLEMLNLSLEGAGYTLDNKTVSVAEDVLGLTDAYLATLLPFTVDPFAKGWSQNPSCQGVITVTETLRACLFQEFLYAQMVSKTVTIANSTITRTVVAFGLPTTLEKFYGEAGVGEGIWGARITAPDSDITIGFCEGNANCLGMSMNVVTSQAYSGDAPSLSLTHAGQSTYVRQVAADEIALVRYQPGPARFVGQDIPAGFPDERVTASVNARVNGAQTQAGVTYQLADFYNLSPVANGWRFEMDVATNAGYGLDLTKIEDFQIQMQIMSRAIQLNGTLAALQETRQALLQQKQPIPAALEAEYDQLMAEFIAEQKAKMRDPEMEQKVIEALFAPTLVADFTEPEVVAGLYQGTMLATGFTEFGVFINATAVAGSQPITATLCITCSALHNVPAALTGWFTDTGTMTNTFFLQSVPFAETVGGQVFTKTITMFGDVIEVGNVISGTYKEDQVDAYGTSFTFYGDFIANRPIRYAGAVTLTLSLSLGLGDFPNASWSGHAANCSHELYRSGTPYFINYDRQMVMLVDDLSFVDTNMVTVGQPIFYQLRALSCDANLDFLEPNASYFQDSQEMGAFAFEIVPGD